MAASEPDELKIEKISDKKDEEDQKKLIEDEREENIEKEVKESIEKKVLTETDDNGFVYYKCRFCGLTYNYMSTLKAHERVHDVAQPYVCPKCDCSFHYNCELKYHSQQHTDQKGWKCECGRTFYRYTDLLYHNHREEDSNMDETPLEKKPLRLEHTCFESKPESEVRFKPKHPLKVYPEIRLRPYICQYCSKSYADSRSLAYHMYGHRGEKMFNPRASRYLMSRID